MPQSSNIYAVARIKAAEKGLIGKERMNRIAESTLSDAMYLLLESGYGKMPEAKAEDCEAMIARELAEAAALVSEVTPDEELTDLFLIRSDIYNLKVLLKARVFGEEAHLTPGGIYPAEKLSAAVRDHQYRDLSPAIKDALDSLEKELAQSADPQRISVALDRAYLSHAQAVLKKHKCAFAAEYFSALADFNNVLAALRLRAMNAGRDSIKSFFLPGGAIAQSVLEAACDQPFEGFARAVSSGPAGSAIGRGLDELSRTGRVSALERERDDHLISLIKGGKYKLDSLEPIVGYLVAKEREAACVRIIITAKRNGLADSVIQERMRELYG